MSLSALNDRYAAITFLANTLFDDNLKVTANANNGIDVSKGDSSELQDQDVVLATLATVRLCKTPNDTRALKDLSPKEVGQLIDEHKMVVAAVLIAFKNKDDERAINVAITALSSLSLCEEAIKASIAKKDNLRRCCNEAIDFARSDKDAITFDLRQIERFTDLRNLLSAPSQLKPLLEGEIPLPIFAPRSTVAERKNALNTFLDDLNERLNEFSADYEKDVLTKAGVKKRAIDAVAQLQDPSEAEEEEEEEEVEETEEVQQGESESVEGEEPGSDEMHSANGEMDESRGRVGRRDSERHPPDQDS